MDPGITFYDVLGAVPDAETRRLKQKYEDKAALLRPGLVCGAPPDVLTAVTRAQHMLDTAWEVLGDPDSRKRYDETAGWRRSGGGLGQPGTGIESAGMAPADLGIAGEMAGGWLGGLLALLPEQLAPRRRPARPGAIPDVRGLFYPVCLEVAGRHGLHPRIVRLTEHPMAVDGLVVDQDPSPPAKAHRGGTLTVQAWHPPRPVELTRSTTLATTGGQPMAGTGRQAGTRCASPGRSHRANTRRSGRVRRRIGAFREPFRAGESA